MIGSSDFVSGFWAGFVVAFILILVVYSVWNLFRGYIKQIKAANKPQVVIHTTSKSPNEVVGEASSAKRKLWLLLFLLYLLLVVGLEIARPGTLRDLLTMIGL